MGILVREGAAALIWVKGVLWSAVASLNSRFLEHQLGYTFLIGGIPQLIRRDNDHVHSGIILPALRLLHAEAFEGANEEYRKAHEHYRHNNYKKCLNDCLKALESTLKTICGRKKWKFAASDTAIPLIDCCLANGLFPAYMSGHFGAIKGALSSAVPTVRNKLSGHGQGEQTVEVPHYYAEYLLNETAACLLFLVGAYQASLKN